MLSRSLFRDRGCGPRAVAIANVNPAPVANETTFM